MTTVHIIYLVVFMLLAFGFLYAAGFEFGTAADRLISRLLERNSLKNESAKAKGKKGNFIITELIKIKTDISKTGGEHSFRSACIWSVILGITGALLPAVLGNVFFTPLTLAGFAAIPFLILKRKVSNYNRRIREELETALSIITNSYVRTDDFIGAVRENVPYIKFPLRIVFEDFLKDATFITSDLDTAVVKLKNSIDNGLFREWCDGIRACLQDRSLKDTLISIVSRFTDTRLINNELKTIVQEPRKEYLVMVIMTLANIPILRLINKEWFDVLFTTIQGKIVMALVAGTILVTGLFLLKFTRPIEYGSQGDST